MKSLISIPPNFNDQDNISSLLFIDTDIICNLYGFHRGMEIIEIHKETISEICHQNAQWVDDVLVLDSENNKQKDYIKLCSDILDKISDINKTRAIRIPIIGCSVLLDKDGAIRNTTLSDSQSFAGTTLIIVNNIRLMMSVFCGSPCVYICSLSSDSVLKKDLVIEEDNHKQKITRDTVFNKSFVEKEGILRIVCAERSNVCGYIIPSSKQSEILFVTALLFKYKHTPIITVYPKFPKEVLNLDDVVCTVIFTVILEIHNKSPQQEGDYSIPLNVRTYASLLCSTITKYEHRIIFSPDLLNVVTNKLPKTNLYKFNDGLCIGGQVFFCFLRENSKLEKQVTFKQVNTVPQEILDKKCSEKLETVLHEKNIPEVMLCKESIDELSLLFSDIITKKCQEVVKFPYTIKCTNQVFSDYAENM